MSSPDYLSKAPRIIKNLNISTLDKLDALMKGQDVMMTAADEIDYAD